MWRPFLIYFYFSPPSRNYISRVFFNFFFTFSKLGVVVV